MTAPRPIHLSVPHLTGDELRHVAAALESNWLTHLGPSVDAFEGEMASRLGAAAALATSSGTTALHLALAVLGVGPGDRVPCSTSTFIASANAIRYLGAEPVFVDADPATWGMSPVALERCLSQLAREGVRPKALVAVHLYGQCYDSDGVEAVASRYGVPIVEDAAEALGATYRGRKAGTLGRISALSFAGNKVVTTSTGGMVLSGDAALVARARYLALQAKGPEGQYDEVGYNGRMSNLLAAVGLAQITALHERVEARRRVFERYATQLAGVRGLGWMPEPSFGRATRWLSVALLEPGTARRMPAEVIAGLAAAKIESRRVFRPLHLEKAYAGAPFFSHAEGGSVAERLYARGLCLPSSSSLTVEDQGRVVEEMKRLLGSGGAGVS